jgi:hypothetical protein
MSSTSQSSSLDLAGPRAGHLSRRTRAESGMAIAALLYAIIGLVAGAIGLLAATLGTPANSSHSRGQHGDVAIQLMGVFLAISPPLRAI